MRAICRFLTSAGLVAMAGQAAAAGRIAEPTELIGDTGDDSGRLVATEFGTSAISSPSEGDALPVIPLGQLLDQVNDEVASCDRRAKNYVRPTPTRDRARADLVAMSSIFAKPYAVIPLASFEIAPGSRRQPLRKI